MNHCTLTDNAKQQINILCDEHKCYAVALSLTGGGCAGLEYVWDIIHDASEVNNGDVVISTSESSRLVVRHESLKFLTGSEIDYKKTILGAGFEISNPNSLGSCGCGVSIQFDMHNLPDISYNA